MHKKRKSSRFLLTVLMIFAAAMTAQAAGVNGYQGAVKYGPATQKVSLSSPEGQQSVGPVTSNNSVSGTALTNVQSASETQSQIASQTLTKAGPSLTGTLTGSYGAGTLKDPRTGNGDLAPSLSGGEIRVLKNKSTDQQELCAVVKSSDGHVLVVDGGVEADSEHLYQVLKEMGSTVDAWLVTHPHGDHVGGLRAILRDHKDINVKNVYYRFFDYSWYQAVDPDEAGMLWVLYDELNLLPRERLHSEMKRNDIVTISEKLSFRVLNDIKQSEGSYAVNSSGLMFDITVDGKHLVVLGDMGETVGNEHYSDGCLEGLTSDYLVTAHHGQNGVGEVFYQMCHPKNVIWNTTEKIYNNTTGKYQTDKTKKWFSGLSIENHYATLKDDVVIR